MMYRCKINQDKYLWKDLIKKMAYSRTLSLRLFLEKAKIRLKGGKKGQKKGKNA